jgi:2-enoate reductase
VLSRRACAVGRESEFRVFPAQRKKKVLVIGGGVAGMEAARVAAVRGHEVTLMEKNEKLGGHLVEASVPKFKEDLKRLINWLSVQVGKVGVRVELKKEVTPEMVKELKPDVLIIAVGSEYIVPKVPGIDKPCVVKADDVLLGRKTVGEKVVVIGGGLVGCETALFIAEELKKKVTIVEMLNEILIGIEPVNVMALKERLGKAGIGVHTGWHLERVTEKGVVCTDKMWENTR